MYLQQTKQIENSSSPSTGGINWLCISILECHKTQRYFRFSTIFTIKFHYQIHFAYTDDLSIACLLSNSTLFVDRSATWVHVFILNMRVVDAYVCNWQLNFQVEIKIKSVSHRNSNVRNNRSKLWRTIEEQKSPIHINAVFFLDRLWFFFHFVPRNLQLSHWNWTEKTEFNSNNISINIQNKNYSDAIDNNRKNIDDDQQTHSSTAQ